MSNKNFKRQFPKWRDLKPLLRFSLPKLNRKKARLDAALTIWDLRTIAKKRTPQGPFDYTDGAAETEVSLSRARQAFLDIEFRPHILRDVSKADLTRTTLGHTFNMPVGIAPTGFTRMMHSEGEIAGARAAEKFGIPFTLSTLGTTKIEDVVAAAPGGTNWFQLYMWKDREGSMRLVDAAAKAGVKNLMLTVDVPASGHRLRDYRNGLTVPPSLTAKTVLNAIPRPEWVWNFLTTPAIEFASMSNWNGTVGELLDYMFDPTMTFEDLKWIREQWKGTLTIKGVQNVEDAKKAADLGVDAVLLSNHGGRQLDGAISSIQALPGIVNAVGKDIEVWMDGGIRSGQDVLKAWALGARGTMIGRPFLYGLGAMGEAGVTKCLELIHNELDITMAFTGHRDIQDVTKDILYPGTF